MQKRVKVILCAALLAALTLALFAFASGCSPAGGEAGGDVVYVHTGEETVASVTVYGPDGSGGAQNADGTPLKKGESLSFDTDGKGWPLEVAVCREVGGRRPLASVTIPEAPLDGARWYVYFQDGALVYGTERPAAGSAPAVWRALPICLLLVGLLILPLAALAVLWVLALVKLPGARRKGLLPAGVVMFAIAGLLFGGELILSRLGLTWRCVPAWAMALALWFLGWTAGILTVIDTRRWAGERSPARGELALAGALACLLAAMLTGTVAGGVWMLHTAPSMERVGEYEGRRVVQTGNAWDDGYHIYDYHGPLVRGREELAWSETPWFAELSLYGADKALGLDLSAGEVLESRDTHGGFHGDGETYVVVRFEGDGLEKQLADWKELPLPEAAERLRRMAEDNACPIPTVEKGYYWVRGDQDKDFPSDGRALAVYDRGSRTLFYYEADI